MLAKLRCHWKTLVHVTVIVPQQLPPILGKHSLLCNSLEVKLGVHHAQLRLTSDDLFQSLSVQFSA